MGGDQRKIKTEETGSRWRKVDGEEAQFWFLYESALILSKPAAPHRRITNLSCQINS